MAEDVLACRPLLMTTAMPSIEWVDKLEILGKHL
jgi:hypothetical protein